MFQKYMKIALLIQDDPYGVIAQSLQVVIANAHENELYYQFEFLYGNETTLDDLKHKVDRGSYWAGFSVNEGASAKLMAALMSPSLASVYDPTAACTFFYDMGRDGITYSQIIGSLSSSLSLGTAGITKKFLALKFASQNISASSIQASVLTNPVGVRSIPLHKVGYWGVHASVGGSITQIYLVTIVQAVLVIKFYKEFEGRGINPRHLVMVPAIHRLIGSAILAFWPPVVLLCLGGGRHLLTATKFWSWWFFLWWTITIFTGFNNMIFHLVGIEIGVLIGILTVLIQVATSGGIFPMDAIPSFYKLGYIFPYYHAVQGSRAILLHSLPHQLNNSIGCYVVWVMLFFVLYSTVCFSWIDKLKNVLELVKPHHDIEAEAREHKRRKSLGGAPPSNLSIFDPSLHKELSLTFKKGIGAEIGLTVFMFIMLLLAVGNIWNPPKNYSRIHLALINNDPGSVGKTVETVRNILHPSFDFTLEVLSPNSLSYDACVKKVRTRHYWGILWVEPDATTTLNTYLGLTGAGNADAYGSATQAMTLIYDPTRGGSLISKFINAYASQFAGVASAIQAQKTLGMAAAQGKKFSDYGARALINPIYLTVDALHKPEYSGVDGSISSAAMALYLGNVVQVLIITGFHMPLMRANVIYEHRALAKALHLSVGCFILSFIPAISCAWWGQTMTGAKFFAYWMFLFLSMVVFGGFIFMHNHIAHEGGVIVNLIFFSLNQASSEQTIPLALQPPFFRIGYGLPFNQIMAGGRYILFGASTDYARAIGVLFGWAIFFLIASYRLNIRRKHFQELCGKKEDAQQVVDSKN